MKPKDKPIEVNYKVNGKEYNRKYRYALNSSETRQILNMLKK